MRYEFEAICLPDGRVDTKTDDAVTLGAPGGLALLLVAAGRLSVPGEEATVLAGAGSVAVGAAPLLAVPVGTAHIVGVDLHGAAVAPLLAAFARPAVLPPQALPSAAGALSELCAGGEDARQSAVAYALVCALATAGRQDAALPQLVAGAMAAIREHYAEVYGIEELAESLGVSKSHLVRSFSAAVRTSPGQYLTQVRVQAAKRLLPGPYPLDTVATLCGFSGANYLCKVFKKHTGETPGEYRARVGPNAGHVPTELEDRLFL